MNIDKILSAIGSINDKSAPLFTFDAATCPINQHALLQTVRVVGIWSLYWRCSSATCMNVGKWSFKRSPMHFTMSPKSPNTYCRTVLSLILISSSSIYRRSDWTKSCCDYSPKALKRADIKSIDLIIKLLSEYRLSLSI